MFLVAVVCGVGGGSGGDVMVLVGGHWMERGVLGGGGLWSITVTIYQYYDHRYLYPYHPHHPHHPHHP